MWTCNAAVLNTLSTNTIVIIIIIILIIRLCLSLMNFSNQPLASFPMLFFLMINGFRPLYQLRTVVWELEGCLRLQLLPSWPLLRALFLCSPESWLRVTSDSVLQANLSSWSLAFGPPPDPLPIKQSFYDRSDVDSVHSQVERSLSPGRTARHHALNNVIYRAFSSAGIPATKEPVGLTRLDGKRPDGLTLVPWCAGQPLPWDATAVSTLADSYMDSAAREAGAPAKQAAIRKISKYSVLSQSYLFQPIAVENTGVLNSSAVDFLNALGRRSSSSSGEERESLFLFQRISITVQRFNAILLHNRFVRDDPDL